MSAAPPNTDQLLERVAAGDAAAHNDLMNRHRDRIRRMIDVHLDDRLRTRIDASDVVQETLAEAATRLSDYARHRPIPFYPWLRAIAKDKLGQLRQHHLHRQKRSVLREEHWQSEFPDSSMMQLSQRLVGAVSSPSQRMARDEQCARVHRALAQLKDIDREVLVLRYLEQLTPKEATAVLAVSEDAYMKRHLRALKRLRALLDDDGEGGVR